MHHIQSVCLVVHLAEGLQVGRKLKKLPPQVSDCGAVGGVVAVAAAADGGDDGGGGQLQASVAWWS